MLSRRSFMTSTVTAALLRAMPAHAQTGPADEKFILSAPLTHSDWMLKPNIQWGEAGVRHMLDACKACGWSQVFWRVLDGGRADYPSKVVRPFHDWDQDSF